MILSPETVEDKHLMVGDKVEILCKGCGAVPAMVTDIYAINLDNELSHAHRTVLTLAVGAHWLEARRIVERFCKSNIAIVVTFRNLW